MENNSNLELIVYVQPQYVMHTITATKLKISFSINGACP